jgi:hypothetical protein
VQTESWAAMINGKAVMMKLTKQQQTSAEIRQKPSVAMLHKITVLPT